MNSTVSAPAPSSAPALYLAVVQFVFVSTWTIYVIFLPALLEGVGVPRQWTARLLLADQMLFVMFDIAAGYAADRVHRLFGRIGPLIVSITAVSCLAFLLLPWLAAGEGAWRAPLFLALSALWVITSSALRAPAFTLITRHAAKPRVPALAGLALMGMALAGAIAPYLGIVLREIDPRLPFAASSTALLALAAGLIWAERAEHAGVCEREEDVRPVTPALGAWRLFPLLALSALAYQVVFNLNAAPRYLRDAQAADLAWLMPVFWIGFNGTVAIGGWLGKHVSNARLFAIACGLGAIGATTAGGMPGLQAAIAGQLIAGLAWGAALVAAFGLTGELSSGPHRDRKATYNGLLFSMLGLATFTRIGIAALGPRDNPAWTALLMDAPAVFWTFATLVTVLFTLRRHAADEAAPGRK